MSQKRKQNTLNSEKSKKIPASQTLEESEDLVNKCVRFFVFQMGKNVPILRQKVIQQVFSENLGKTADLVIKKAAEILDNVQQDKNFICVILFICLLQIYGIELQLLESDTSSIKKYVLVNKLEHCNLVIESANENFKALITILSLTHIFMSKGICSERMYYCKYSELKKNPNLLCNIIF